MTKWSHMFRKTHNNLLIILSSGLFCPQANPLLTKYVLRVHTAAVLSQLEPRNHSESMLCLYVSAHKTENVCVHVCVWMTQWLIDMNSACRAERLWEGKSAGERLEINWCFSLQSESQLSFIYRQLQLLMDEGVGEDWQHAGSRNRQQSGWGPKAK